MSDTSAAAPAGASPIADLSYRNYDGHLQSRTFRWRVIAEASVRTAVKKRGFWILFLLSCIPYIFTGLMLYLRPLTEGLTSMSGDNQPQKFVDSFYLALVNQSFFLFLMALIAGTGSIASDLRANALQVYLSKPITKRDYLIGKWMGIFLPVYATAFLPAFFLFVFCLLHSTGFWAEVRLMILRLVAATAMPGIIHASLLMGFSAWSRTGFLAGSFYAAFYFVSRIAVGTLWLFKYGIPNQFDPSKGLMLKALSVDGLTNGLSQNLYRATLKPSLMRRSEGFDRLAISIPPPDFRMLAMIGVAVVILAIYMASRRVRAVEVVTG